MDDRDKRKTVSLRMDPHLIDNLDQADPQWKRKIDSLLRSYLLSLSS